MKLLLRLAAAALGLTFLCYLPLIGPLVSPGQKWIYHDSGVPALVVFAVLVDMMVCWALLTLLLWLARKPGRVRIWLWSGIVLLAPWVLVKDVFILCDWLLAQWFSRALFVVMGLCWIAACSLMRPAFVALFDRLEHFFATVFSFAGLCAVMVIGQMLWYCLAERSMQLPAALHAAAPRSVEVRGQKPRILWIILDELSYQQVYERRFPSLDLPAFDQLASQSTVFTHVVPAALYTEDAVPSMMTGLSADDIRVRKDATLRSLHDPVTGRWRPFHAQDTVFQDAIGHGFRTAVAGWFNPYCRILSTVLDQCQWVSRENIFNGTFSDASVLANIADPWVTLAGKLGLHRHGSMEVEELRARDHIADYEDIASAGDRFLGDPTINFLLLHVPVPHPGGIYDRQTRSFTTHRASYIDNLALADRYLAHVHELLEQRGEWDSSAVIVMGDHSWRTKPIWESSSYWTAEDQAASHGGEFDDRPAYIVKLPHQTAAARIDTRFAAVRTRDLFDGILDGSILTVPELAAFVQRSSATR